MILDAYFMDNRLDTAVHEAGHAVMAFYSGVAINKATIRQEGNAAGHVSITQSLSGELQYLDGRLTLVYSPTVSQFVMDGVYAAGYAACVLYDKKYDMASDRRTERHSQGASADWALIQGNRYEAVVHATRVLENNWFKVEALAIALLEAPSETLTGAQVEKVLREARRPVFSAPIPQPEHVSVPDSVPMDWAVDSKGSVSPKPASGYEPDYSWSYDPHAEKHKSKQDYLSRSPRNKPPASYEPAQPADKEPVAASSGSALGALMGAFLVLFFVFLAGVGLFNIGAAVLNQPAEASDAATATSPTTSPIGCRPKGAVGNREYAPPGLSFAECEAWHALPATTTTTTTRAPGRCFGYNDQPYPSSFNEDDCRSMGYRWDSNAE